MNSRHSLRWALVAVLLALGAPVRAQFRVVGYLPAWRGEVNPAQLAQLTHVNYAFVQPTATGGLEPLPNHAKLRRLVAAAHAAGVRVLVSVGGWHDGDHRAFDAIGANAAYINAFVTSLGQFAAEYHLDGIDIDWEHPDANTAAGYGALMQALAAQLHPRGLLLTAAVAGGTWAGPGVPGSVFEAVDFLNIMASFSAKIFTPMNSANTAFTTKNAARTTNSFCPRRSPITVLERAGRESCRGLPRRRR